MIYTNQMRQAVRQVRVPHEFVVNIVEYDMDKSNPFLALRFYEQQWNHYNDTERLHCISYLDKIKRILTSFGVNVTLEPVIDTGDSLPEKYRKVYKESL